MLGAKGTLPTAGTDPVDPVILSKSNALSPYLGNARSPETPSIPHFLIVSKSM